MPVCDGQPGCAEETVDVSILVPVLNEARHLEHSVAAMRRQRFDGRLEFIFADGGSDDGSREILERLRREDPRIRICDNPRRTVSSGLNVALAHARGRWVARMDAHAVYPSDYVALGVTRLGAGDTRWVSGPQVPVGDGRISRAVALALRSWLGRGGSRKWASATADHRQGAPADNRLQDAPADNRLQGEFELDSGVFAGVWERATLLEYGGWDERWPRNSDSEMAGRFLARGERLVCLPAMAAAYVPRGSLRGLWRQYLGYGEYRFRTAARHPHTLRRSHLLAPAVVIDTALALASPGPVRRLARLGLGIYATAIAVTAIRALPDAEEPADALLVAPVLAVMHFAHGLGALRAARQAPPLAALSAAVGLGRLSGRLADEPDSVYAPSLGSQHATSRPAQGNAA